MSESKTKRRKIIIEDKTNKTNIIFNLLKNQELILDLLKKQDIILNKLDIKNNHLKKEIVELKYFIYDKNNIFKSKQKVYEKDMCNDMKNAYI